MSGQRPARIEFPYCSIEWIPEMQKCVTEFRDGTQAHAVPHYTEEYFEVSARLSTGNVALQCWQHDLAHVIVGMMNGGVSTVLWRIAHGLRTDTPECIAEEKAVQAFQEALFLR